MTKNQKPRSARSPATHHTCDTSRTALRRAALASGVGLALLALSAQQQAWAQTSIGELEVRSRLGEAFYGAIPVDTGGKPLDPQCIRVRPHPDPATGAATLVAPRIRVNPTGAVDSVIVQTGTAVSEPVVGFRLEVGCDDSVVRDFLVMADPPAVQVAALPESTTAPAPVIVPAPAPRRPPRPARAPGAEPRAAPVVPLAAAPAVPPAEPAAKPQQPPRAAKPAAAPPPATAKRAGSEPRLIVHVDTELKQLEANTSLTDGQRDALRRSLTLRGRDDEQLARLLEMQHRIAALQAEAERLKAALEQAAGVRSTGPGGTATTASAAALPAAAAPSSDPVRAQQGSPSGTSSPAGTPAPAAPPAATTPPPPSAAPAEPNPATAPQSPSAAPPVTAPKPTVVPPATPPTAAPAPRKEPWLGIPTEWTLAAIAAAAIGLITLAITRLRRSSARREPAGAAATTAPVRPVDHEKTVMLNSPLLAPTAPATLPRPIPAFSPDELQAEAPPTAEFMVAPATMDTPTQPVSEKSRMSRSGEHMLAQRYMTDTQTFDPLGDPEAVVRKARIYYLDDGDPFKAIDLLELGIAGRPGETRLWQALFAIYRREEMAKRYEMLAKTYQGKFRDDEHWPAIQTLGVAIDPDNPLYRGGATRTRAAGAPDQDTQEILDRWLGVPLDFTGQLLSNELHDRLTSPGRRRGTGEPPRT